MNEMKNVIWSFNSRLNQVEERICKHENRSPDIIRSGEKKEIRMKKSEKRGPWVA